MYGTTLNRRETNQGEEKRRANTNPEPDPSLPTIIEGEIAAARYSDVHRYFPFVDFKPLAVLL